MRAVLRDVLPTAVIDAARTASSSAQATTGRRSPCAPTPTSTPSSRRVAALCADPARRAALQEGRHGFRLAASGDAAPAAGAVVRVDRGAVTERTVSRAAADGARLVLGKGAVLTPLARDKARSLGIALVRES